VDNPHTKPVAFWQYLIGEVREQYPEAIFLSEAFTRPKMMNALAKVGFTQSYTYFTWRNTRWELTEYLTELTRSESREFFRPNFFANTPDILPFYLQHGGHAAFMVRAVLAGTLSPVYGIYSGFELCENAPLPGREEYFESEKYQFKARDWNAPGNIKGWITAINTARKKHRSLQEFANLEFHPCANENLLVYSKVTEAGDDRILVVVNLDPHYRQSGYIEVPLGRMRIHSAESFEVHDLLSGARYRWVGPWNYVELDPGAPAHVFHVVT
jgi:starch synthase (maltosyl-transferring)